MDNYKTQIVTVVNYIWHTTNLEVIFIQFINQGLSIKILETSYILSNQMRAHEIIINNVPKNFFLTEKEITLFLSHIWTFSWPYIWGLLFLIYLTATLPLRNFESELTTKWLYTQNGIQIMIISSRRRDHKRRIIYTWGLYLGEFMLIPLSAMIQ